MSHTSKIIYTASLSALTCTLYFFDFFFTRAIPIPWLTSFIYFLPLIIIAAFLGIKYFLRGWFVVIIVMFLMLSQAGRLINILQFLLDYALPALACGIYAIHYKFQTITKYTLLKHMFAVSFMFVIILFSWTLSGILFFNADFITSMLINLPLAIFSLVSISVLALPTLQFTAKIIKS